MPIVVNGRAITPTPWSNGQNPAMRGPYQVLTKRGDIRYQHWNGWRWGTRCTTPESAERHQSMFTSFPNPTWRGLSQDPAAKPG